MKTTLMLAVLAALMLTGCDDEPCTVTESGASCDVRTVCSTIETCELECPSPFDPPTGLQNVGGPYLYGCLDATTGTDTEAECSATCERRCVEDIIGSNPGFYCYHGPELLFGVNGGVDLELRTVTWRAKGGAEVWTERY